MKKNYQNLINEIDEAVAQIVFQKVVRELPMALEDFQILAMLYRLKYRAGGGMCISNCDLTRFNITIENDMVIKMTLG